MGIPGIIITVRHEIVGPPARSAWSASYQRPGSPWLAALSLRSGNPVSGYRTASIRNSRSSPLSKLFYADVFPGRAGKTPERMGCGLFLPSAAPQAEVCGRFGRPPQPRLSRRHYGCRRSVSADLTADKTSATGGCRRFAPKASLLRLGARRRRS